MDAKERKRIFWIWCAMRYRCQNPNNKGFPYYGGRGIEVSARWRVFGNFVQDMGPRPDGYTLERLDNNGNYEPRNCRWATRIQQNSNRRNCLRILLNGEMVTLKEACRRIGIKYRPVHKRIMARGWDVQRALYTPIGGSLAIR